MPNYQPQVTYNVPVVQPVQFHEVQRPDINVQPIDLGGFFKGLAISAASKEKEDADNRYNEGLNKYAIRLNQIAEGQRQGVYKQSDAERLTRQLDDEYLAGGWKAADLYKVRDHFDGGVRKLEEAHQKKLMEADTDFRLKQVDSFREMYPAYRNKDRDVIEGKLDELSKMEQDFQYYTNMLNAGATEKEVQYAAAKRGDTATDLARANTMLQLEQMIADPSFNPSQMTQATYDAMRQNLALNLQNRGMNYADSTAAADRALENLNVRQYVNDIKMDADNNTDFMKKMNDNMTESGRSQLLSLPNMPLLVNIKNTALMDSIVTKAGNPVEKLGEQISQASENPDVFRSGYRTVGAASVNDSEVFSQIYSANVKDRIYPVRKLAQQALVTSKTLADTVRNPFDLSGVDLDTNNTNNTKALALLKSPDAEAQRAKAATFNDPILKSTYEATDANIAKLEGNQIAYDLLKSGNNPRNLLNSLQASRMRIDDEGYLRMTEGTDGVLQSLGDLLASNETGNEVNTLNKALEKYTPEQRKALLNLASNGEIKPLAAGEAVWDTTTKSLKERAAEAANKGGQYLMELLSFSGSNEETTPAFSQGVLDAAGNLGIDDIPLEYSTSVSNTSTIGGASLVPQENMSARALRQYADRLEASVESVKSTGAKTEKGKLENDRKLIEAARAKADELEGIVRVTSKVSNRSTIGGASFAEDLTQARAAQEALSDVSNDEGNAASVDYRTEEDINKVIERIEKQQEALRKVNKDGSEEYQKLSTIKARLYNALGEGDD